MKRSLFLLLAALPLGAVDVTVYNDDLALVREKRSFTFKKGNQDLAVTDVAARIDPTSLHFKPLAEGGVTVLEQNFEYDLVNVEKILSKFIGRPIDWERPAGEAGKRETLSGTLLATAGGAVLQVGKKIYVNPEGRPVLPERPEGFVLKPTLLWKVASKREGPQDCEIGYLTGGLSWRSDYIVKINSTDDRMDMNAWVTVNNRSGASYEEAKLKLVAGDVNRAPPEGRFQERGARMPMMAAAEMDGGFQEKAFFEYHLYTLQRPATVRDNQTKQIEMARAQDVPVKKLFIYDPVARVGNAYSDYTRTDSGYGLTEEKKVWVILEFRNSKDNNLGLPLPKGLVRVYKQDSDGALEFVGEDRIDHTPKDEDVRVKMGNAFDVVGERKRTNYQVSTDRKSMTETFEITLRNHKPQAVTVRSVEHLYRWTNWKVTESSRKFTKRDAQTIEFDLPVAADGESKVTYTVRYSW